jgi:hypothetical protein
MPERDVTLRVGGWPPAKNEAKSLFAPGHTHADRVIRLLEAAQEASQEAEEAAMFGALPIGLELTVMSPDEPFADATNFLGGVGDVLEVKSRRQALEHLGALADVGLYQNDRHIHAYVVHIWELSDQQL